MSASIKLLHRLHFLLDRSFALWWPSYALVTALQVKLLWKIWVYRDFTLGDTSVYFSIAYQWASKFAVNIVWSPIYTIFYGTIFDITHDAYYATIGHRFLIVMAATLGILAVMRRLLPPALALAVALWWSVLPINFETWYGVHLFALLPILGAWLIIGYSDTLWGRGIALGIFFSSAVLIRNELLVAFVVFLVVCIVREMGSRDSNSDKSPRHVIAYGLPLLLSGILILFCYWRSEVKYPQIIEAAREKHTLNMCQVYAFGYQQRHPEWTDSPWTECQSLMEKTFGQPQPSLTKMILENPGAVSEHFLWNLSLVPNGVQSALFNSMSGKVNPDYAFTERSQGAARLSLLAGLTVLAGVIVLVLDWRRWYETWFRERQGMWLILFATLVVSVPVILTQRPRPSYLFASTVVFMAVIGNAVHILINRWATAQKMIAAVVGIGLIVIVPAYYPAHPSDRSLYRIYEAVLPLRPLLARPDTVFMGRSADLVRYLGLIYVPIQVLDYSALSQWKDGENFDGFLKSSHVTLLYLDPSLVTRLRGRVEARELLESPEALGWKRLAYAPRDDWLLLYRPSGK